MARTKTIKLSEKEYNLLKLSREKLIQCGVDSLPTPLRTEILKLLKGEKLALGKMVGIVALTLQHTLNEEN